MMVYKKDGEFLKRWEKFKMRWKHAIPIISIDKFFYDTINEAKAEYPVWKKLIEDLEPDDNGFEVIINYIRSLWRWIRRWW